MFCGCLTIACCACIFWTSSKNSSDSVFGWTLCAFSFLVFCCCCCCWARIDCMSSLSISSSSLSPAANASFMILSFLPCVYDCKWCSSLARFRINSSSSSVVAVSLLNPRICSASATRIKSFKFSFVICTSPKYIYSSIAFKMSKEMSWKKNIGCDDLLSFKSSLKYGEQLYKTSLWAPSFLPSHANVMSTKSSSSLIRLK